jgi:hypothetical protein
MIWKALCCVIAILSLVPTRTTFAAEFRVVWPCPNGCNAYIYVIGTIESGDGDKFRDVIRRTGPAIDSLFLRSPGGSMYDSIKIGTIASDLMIDTYAPYGAGQCSNHDSRFGVYNAPCTCVSGCFLIWMGGLNRYGITVGMHRPWDMGKTMGKLKYKEAALVYNRWIEDLKIYLTKMELPDVYFAKFIATVRSGEMKMLTNDDLLSLNNNPSKTEWLLNRCGEFPSNKTVMFGQLSQNKFQGRPYNVLLWQQLEDEYNKIRVCKVNALTEARSTAFNSMFFN